MGANYGSHPMRRTGVEHYGTRDLEHYLEKLNRYTSIEALQLSQRGATYDWRSAVSFMAHDLWEHYELHNARLDGERGWVLTWLAAQYRWLSVTKLIDLGCSSEQLGGASSVPRDLDEFLQGLEQELAVFRKDTLKLPLGIVWRSALWDPGFGAAESRTCIVELARGSRKIVVEDLPGVGNFVAEQEQVPLLQALQRCRRANHVLTITRLGPLVVPPDRCACYNVLRVAAGALVPDEAMPQINAYDEIWAESASHLQSLRVRGIAPERARIVPLLNPPAVATTGSDNGHSGTIETEIARIEEYFRHPRLPVVRSDQLHVVLEGEFFAGHSFSNINEQLAAHLCHVPDIALSLRRRAGIVRAVRYCHWLVNLRRILSAHWHTRPMLPSGTPFRPIGTGPRRANGSTFNRGNLASCRAIGCPTCGMKWMRSG